MSLVCITEVIQFLRKLLVFFCCKHLSEMLLKAEPQYFTTL